VGNAAKVDAFRSGFDPAHAAYLTKLQQRAQVLLSGDHSPTPDEPEVNGIEDDYYSDTDDELGLDHDEDDSSDAEEECYSSFGQPWSLPEPQHPWASAPAASFGQWAAPPQADVPVQNEPGTASTTSVVTAWLVIRELTRTGTHPTTSNAPRPAIKDAALPWWSSSRCPACVFAGHIGEHVVRTLQSMLRDDGASRRQVLRLRR
jgi:hypothetical protein